MSATKDCYLEPTFPVYPLLQEVFESSIEEADFTDSINTISDLYDSFSSQGFEKSFVHILRVIFSESTRDGDVRKILRFIAECVVTLDGRYKKENATESTENIESIIHPMLKNVFIILEKWSEASLDTIRSRSCLLLQMILTRIQDHDEGEIDMVTFEKISKVIEARRLDTKPKVRAEAVLLAKFFQDPGSMNDPVIEGLCWQLQYDPSAKVRQNIATILAACEESVLPLTKRFLYDTNVSVRNAALLHICNRISPRIYTESQRVLILNQCFNDPSETVRQNAETKLIPMWLKAYKNSMCKFFESFRIGHDTLDNLVFIDDLLQILYKITKISQILQEVDIDLETLLPKAELTAEQAFLWRHFYKLAHKGTHLLKYLPTTEVLLDYILKYFDSASSSPTLYNELAVFLIEILKTQGTEQRSKVLPAMLDALRHPSIPHQVVPYIVPLYLSQSPSDKNVKCDEVLAVVEDLQKLIEFSTPDQVKNILLKCFTIASEVLMEETFLRDRVKCLKDNLIMQFMETEDPELKLLVVSTLTLYCLLDSHEARSSWSYFANATNLPTSPLKHALLKGCFDIMKCYAFQLFACGLENGIEEFENAAKTFLSEMEVEDETERSIVVLGVLKLYTSHLTQSPSILSQVLLLYFHPDEYLSTQKEIEDFLKSYCTSREALNCIYESFLEVIEELYEASKNSVYHKVSIKSAAQKLIELSKRFEDPSVELREVRFEDELVLKLFNKFIEKPWRLPAIDLYSICSSVIPKHIETLATMKQQVETIIENLDSAIYQRKNPYTKKTNKNFAAYLKKLSTALSKAPMPGSSTSSTDQPSPLEKRLFDSSNDCSVDSDRDFVTADENEKSPEWKTPRQGKTPARAKTTGRKVLKPLAVTLEELNASF